MHTRGMCSLVKRHAESYVSPQFFKYLVKWIFKRANQSHLASLYLSLYQVCISQAHTCIMHPKVSGS